MDNNQLKVLRDVGFVIPEQCDLCVHGVFQTSAAVGECSAFKGAMSAAWEAGAVRVYRYGHCEKKFKPDEQKLTLRFGAPSGGSWRRLLERRKYTRSNRHRANTSY